MDLLLGFLVLTALSAATFYVGLRIARDARPRVVEILIAGVILLMAAYVLWGRDNILIARFLPFSNLIVITNVFPLGVGFLTGVVWQKFEAKKVRRIFYAAGLVGVALYSVAHPFIGEIPACGDEWQSGVCMQTTDSTCSPACAATLLADKGIPATEQELAELCLTRKGTTWQGIYRGLKLKTAGTPWHVEVFSGSADDLQKVVPGPIILTVGIPRGASVPRIYTERYGWAPGLRHSVVMYDFAPNDRVDMGDPSVKGGREQWTTEDLRVLYRGQGLRLVRR